MSFDGNITDPARELVDLAVEIRQGSKSSSKGDAFLANKFDVRPWSVEFFKILACILERIDGLQETIASLSIDGDIKSETLSNLATIRAAFGQDALQRVWNDGGGIASNLRADVLQPVKMLSPYLRDKYPIRKLTPAEEVECLELVDQLSSWLKELQLTEHDFIRQAIIDGLAEFRLRLTKVRWLGWGYATESLKELVTAYLALERAVGPIASKPVENAMLQKYQKTLSVILSKAHALKDNVELAQFGLVAYGAVRALGDGVSVFGGTLPPMP